MEENIKELIKKFIKIKKTGWVEGVKNGYGSGGLTFEKCLGIKQNILEAPDYKGIEIKTKIYNCKKHITLFNYSPAGPNYYEIDRIRKQYGYPHSKIKEFNVLNKSVHANRLNRISDKYYFKLNIDILNNKIVLMVFNKYKELIENVVYWDLNIIKEKLYRKMNYLCVVKYIKKSKNKRTYFKYYDISIYKLKNFEAFLELLKNDDIKLNFRIGVFLYGDKKGLIHDHGTSFSIDETNLDKLYNKIHI